MERAPPVLVTILYCFAATFGTFVGGLWASAGIGGAAILLVATGVADRRVPRPDPRVAACVLGFLGMVALLNLVALDPPVAWRRLWIQATILVPLAIWSAPAIQVRIDAAILWPSVVKAAFVGGIALGVELWARIPLLHAAKGAGAEVTFYNRGISYLAVFAFPLLAYLWTSGRRWQAVAFLVVLALPAALTDSRATRMALYLGLASTLVAVFVPRLVGMALALVYGALALMPWSVTALFIHDQSWIRRMPPSWQHRVEIWDYMSYRIFDRPILGWGMGNSRLLDYALPHGESYAWVTERAGHPHNGVIQLWVELGLPGALFGAAVALYLLWRCMTLPTALRPFGYGAWVAALCVSLVAYNFWDDSTFCLFALTILAFRILARPGEPCVRASSPEGGSALRPAELAEGAAMAQIDRVATCGEPTGG